MIGKLLKNLLKSGKKATESVGKSMEFIDDLLEKEVIVGTVESIKESTGKVAEKAGSFYQNTKELIEGQQESISDSMLDTSGTLKNVMKEGESMVKRILGQEEEE